MSCLIIYSVTSLNNVSWGTREAPKKVTPEEAEANRKAAEAAARLKKESALFGLLNRTIAPEEEEGSLEFSCAGLFKLMCCTQAKPNEEAKSLARIEDGVDKLVKQNDNSRGMVNYSFSRRSSGITRQSSHALQGIAEDEDELLSPMINVVDDWDNDSDVPMDDDLHVDMEEQRDNDVNPYWIEDKEIEIASGGRSDVDFLDGKEKKFFQDLIETYLPPMPKDSPEEKERQKKIASDLKDLRDSMSFNFFIINGLFILMTFLLQINKESIHIDWPLNIQCNVTFDQDLRKIVITKEYMPLEPVGLVFVFFFGAILISQLIGMLLHRWSTLSHILSTTDVVFHLREKKAQKEQGRVEYAKSMVEAAKNLQKLAIKEVSFQPGGDVYSGAGAGTNMLSGLRRKKTLAGAFEANLKKVTEFSEENPDSENLEHYAEKFNLPRKSLAALEIHRRKVDPGRRESLARRASIGPLNLSRRGSAISAALSRRASAASGNRRASVASGNRSARATPRASLASGNAVGGRKQSFGANVRRAMFQNKLTTSQGTPKGSIASGGADNKAYDSDEDSA